MIVFKVRKNHGQNPIYLEVILRKHGSPIDAINCVNQLEKPATLENIISACEAYDRQEESPERFFNGEYNFAMVIINLAELIKSGVVVAEVVPDAEVKS